MAEFDIPTYALDRSPSNLSTIESMKEGREANILVYQVENPNLAPLQAKALRVGNDFDVVVKIGADEQKFGWNYDLLMQYVKAERDKQS